MMKCEDCGCELKGCDYTEYQDIIRCFYCLNLYETTILYDKGVRKAIIRRCNDFLEKTYEDGSVAKLYKATEKNP
jgi:hypothetical protein